MSVDRSAAPSESGIPAPMTIATWAVAVLMWLYYLTPIFLPGGADDPLKNVLLIVPPLIAIALLAVRRPFPVGAALLTGCLLLVAPGAIGAAFVAQANLARRGDRVAVTVLAGGWMVAAKVLSLLVGPFSGPWDQPSTVEMTIAGAGLVIATLAGWLAGSRAAESQSRVAMDRARGETEAVRIDRARLAEREAIAREMHDVLAHRLSLVAMHAGILGYRTDLPADETRETAQLIQRNAQQSLEELRTVLSTLRGADDPPEPPQPTLAELPVLVADTDQHQQVDLRLAVDPRAVPTVNSRHAFRVVQESLTNARKHAPGAPVRVEVDGHSGDTLRVRVTNPLSDLVQADRSGSGFGLLGLTERAESVGGTARYGVEAGQFTVEVLMPWKEQP